MSRYYLMAQLPSLDAVGENTQLPITEKRFFELCADILGKKAADAIEKLTLTPERDEKPTGYKMIDLWNENERQLRLALATVRAEKLKKQDKYNENISFPQELLQVAHTAVDFENPIEAEKYLDNFRINFLESNRPMDNFCEDNVFYYGLKLKILSRKCAFDENSGKEAYKKIYNSILSRERQEA